MPTKPNYGGQQQPYVPAGNGDPSGEYADQAGGNVNYFTKSFHQPGSAPAPQPSGQTQAVPPAPAPAQAPAQQPQAKPQGAQPQIEVKPTGKPEQSKFKDFGEYVKANVTAGPKVSKFVEDSFSKGDPESQAFVFSELSKNEIKIGKSDRKESYCDYNSDKPDLYFGGLGNQDFYQEGQTFYHEVGHSIDHIHGTAGRDKYGLPVIGGPKTASASIKLSTGLTLLETIEKYNPQRGMAIEEARTEMDAVKQDLSAKNPAMKRYFEQTAAIESELNKMETDYKSRMNDLFTRYSRGEIGDQQFADERRKTVSEHLNDQKLAKLRSDYEKLASPNDMQYKLELAKEQDKRFGDVSDIFQAATGGSYLNMGHSPNYFRHDRDVKAHEFFAEYFSAKAANKASYDLINKYFPEASKACEELIGIIKGGQSNGTK